MFNNLVFNEDFDLREVIINDDAYLVFGGSFEMLIESGKIFGEDEMILIIRNKEEDNIHHPFTMKYAPKNSHQNDKEFHHDGHYGLPITFSRDDLDTWEVFIGDGKIKEAENIKKKLSKKERKFISAVVKELGDEILDYWEVENTNKPSGKNELETIRNTIKNSVYNFK